MTRQRADAQGGFTLVTVMVFMALLMLFGGTFVNHVMTAEESEVEGLLAESRAYWAMIGHYNYMASRAAQLGLCAGGTKEVSRALNQDALCTAEALSGSGNGTIIGSLRDDLDHADEIQDGSIDNPGELIWVYPQNPVANGRIRANPTTEPYRFGIRATVSDRPTTAVTINDGQLRLDLVVSSVGTAPVVANLGDRVQRLTIGFCVVDLLTDTGSLLQSGNNAASCPSAYTPPVEGESHIQFIVRNHPLP